MKETTRLALTGQDIRIGISVALSLLLCQFTPIQALAACTSAIMCAQDGGKPSWKFHVNPPAGRGLRRYRRSCRHGLDVVCKKVLPQGSCRRGEISG